MSLNPPRFELPVVGKDGKITREWYRYLVGVGKSITSATLEDDLTLQATDADVSQAVAADRMARDAVLMASLGDYDKPQAPDSSLLAWWPQ